MKKILLTIILIMGVFLMLKPINSIIKDSIGNILFRGNVVTGIVDTDNGNGSYNVFISESDKAYPKIFTLAENPDIEVGDKVRILYKNGDRDNPIILPPVTTAITRFNGFIFGYERKVGSVWPNFYALYDMDGNLIREIQEPVSGMSFASSFAMDLVGNIYVIWEGETLNKYNNNLELIATASADYPSWIYDIAMGNDGYIYTLEDTGSAIEIIKRNAADFSIVSSIIIDGSGWGSYDGLCLDENGNFYSFDSSNKYIRKYSSDGVELANEYIECYPVPALGIAGDNLYFGGASYPNDGYYLPLNLSSHAVWDMDGAINYRIATTNDFIICAGWDANNDSVIAKYDSNRNLIWKKLFASGNGNPINLGGYNF